MDQKQTDQEQMDHKQTNLKQGDLVRFCGRLCEVVSIDQHGVRLRRAGRRLYRPPVWSVPAEWLEKVSEQHGEV